MACIWPHFLLVSGLFAHLQHLPYMHSSAMCWHSTGFVEVEFIAVAATASSIHTQPIAPH